MLLSALKTIKTKLSSILNSSDRRAKVQDSDFIIGLLQAVASSKNKFSLADLCRSVCVFLAVDIGTSAFNERLGTPSLLRHLTALLETLIARSLMKESAHGTARGLAAKLGVKEIIGVDASMVTLWNGLAGHFQGTFMTSALKLNLAINLETAEARWYEISNGISHDSMHFPPINPGALYIFDLGYVSAARITDITTANAFYLCRLKAGTRFTVAKVVYGIGQSIIGANLLGYAIKNKRSAVIELIVSSTRYGIEVEQRALGFWNKKARKYHWYLTNMKSKRSLIYDLYRLRWQIELGFKAMKSTLNFDHMPTTNKNAALSLALVAIINFVLTAVIKAEGESSSGKEEKSSIQRAAKIFALLVRDIFQRLTLHRRLTAKAVKEFKQQLLAPLRAFFDPNRSKRKTTLGRLLEA